MNAVRWMGLVCGIWLGAAVYGDQAFWSELELGTAEGRTRAAWISTGSVYSETLDTEMGTLKQSFAVLTLDGAKSTLELQVSHPLGSSPLILEVREIHNRRPHAFGYRVSINGEDVYFRTYQEYGAGPNHYFIAVPSDLARSGDPMRIGFRHEGGGPASIERVWVYPDYFARVAEPEQIYKPMGVLLPHRWMATEEQRAAYAGMVNYQPVGLLAFAGYGYGDLDTRRNHLQAQLERSAEVAMPIQLIANGTGWGGIPDGPDGLGGYFSDLRYSIIRYDPVTRSYRPSWPGMWGPFSTPTLRDPWLNAFLEQRFQRVYGGLRDELDHLAAHGRFAQPIIVREFAPVSGEVSPFNIETARAEGLKLDPSVGLTHEERVWMHRDASRFWQEKADSTVRWVGRESVEVNHGEVTLPEEQLLDRLFSHPDFLGTWPVNDVRWSGGQMGMVDGLWSSGEMGQGDEYRDIAMYDYVRARGKLAMINMERTILKENFSVLKNHYARGFDFVCLFNAYDTDTDLVRSVDGIHDEPAPPAVHREPVLLDVIVGHLHAPGPVEQIVELDNLKVYNGLRLAVGDTSQPGRVVYRLAPADGAFTSGLNLHLDGRVSPGEANRLEVWCGPSPDALERVTVLKNEDLPCPDYWTPWMTSETSVDLGTGMMGQDQWYVALVFHAGPAPDAVIVLSLQVGSQWPWRSGHMDGQSFTHREERTLQLWVQQRAMAERWMEKYRALGGEDEALLRAEELVRAGWYASALRLLAGEVSQLLPARYRVRGHGRLGRYPVEVQMEHDEAVVVTLYALDADGAEFSIRALSDEALSVRISFPEWDRHAGWRVDEQEDRRYRIMRGAGLSPHGLVPFDVIAQPRVVPKIPLPSRLSGRYLRTEDGRLYMDLQDIAQMDYNEFMALPLASDLVYERRAHRSAQSEPSRNEPPEPMDRVDVTLNDAGEIVAVQATYGLDRGRIRRFVGPAPMESFSNGMVELDNGRHYELDFSKNHGTQFDTVAMQGTILNYELRALPEGLRPGMEIELAYHPPADEEAVPRMTQIRQPRRVVLEQDYTALPEGEWRAHAWKVQGVDVVPHRPEPNYLYKVAMNLMRPSVDFEPGHVIYRFEQDHPFGITAVEFAARAFEDSSRVTFYVSPDGETWQRAGQFDNTWQNNISQVLQDLPWQFMDLTDHVAGRTVFFLKVELAVHEADGRYCLAKLRVATEMAAEK